MPLILVALLTAAVAAQGTDATHDPWSVFTSLHVVRQHEVIRHLFADVPDALLIQTQRKVASKADLPQMARGGIGAERRSKEKRNPPPDPDLLCTRLDYYFGTGAIAPRGAPPTAKSSGKPKAKPKPKPKPDAKALASAPPDGTPLRQALRGLVPDADKVVAAIMQMLDTDASADDYAAFLESWRNEHESFYEALDRTSGTEEAVFFFDAMLNDFTSEFTSKGDVLRQGGLQEAHDALHAAFLSYRQYRGFREAVAWSLVLPPDLPLPPRLARYEAKQGGYSLREQVVMASSALDHDYEKLVTAILQKAPRLPRPLWAGQYDPFPAWNAMFKALLPTMIERAGNSDEFLARSLAERRLLAMTMTQHASEQVKRAAAMPKPQ
jgi:hypothetical protein